MSAAALGLILLILAGCFLLECPLGAGVWWDMMFDSYENPKEFYSTCGFNQDKELRHAEMWAWQEVRRK